MAKTSFRSQEVLGKALLDHQEKVVLQIGRDSWTRQALIDELHCGNFVAAAKLTKVLRDLDVKSVKDAYRSLLFTELMAIRGVGVTCLYVLMTAMEARALNPLVWVDWDREPRTLLTKITHARIEFTRKPKKAKAA